MIELRASVDIASPAHAVWEVLTDFARFHEWNPFICQASGAARVGADIRVRVRSSIGMPLVFHAEVLHCLVDRELRWRGHVLAPWLADGEHSFTIEPRAHDQVRFGQREVFTGVLSWLAGRLIARETRKGFAAMNAALKARVEDARPATSCESCASE